jgi:thiamine biosynthesis protein ThiS
MSSNQIITNGKPVNANLPCSIEAFLLTQNFLPCSVVVELNGEAVTHSEFSERQIESGDRLQIIKIVAGG